MVEPDYYLTGELPDEAYRDYMLAKRFGWTPVQVDQIPHLRLQWLMAVMRVAEETGADDARPGRGDDQLPGG